MNKQERQTQILNHISDIQPDQLISTRQLAEEFEVSEITMRRDLQELADEGLIHRQHGGVTMPKVAHSLQTIGILLVYDYGKFSNPFFNELLEGADKELQNLGYHLGFVKTITEANTEEIIHSIVQQHPVKGLLIIGGLHAHSLKIWESLVPNIVLTLAYSNENNDAILFDGVGGMRKMVAHLKEQGHHRIGFVIQHNFHDLVDERITGYCKGVAENGLDDDPALIVQVEAAFPRIPAKIGREGAETLMALDNPPTAIMCSSDLIALGAMQWLQINSYQIPDDIAVSGFDNIPDASVAFPPLTTVHVHKEYVGKLAVNQLHRRILEPDAPPIKVITPTSLICRQSTQKV